MTTPGGRPPRGHRRSPLLPGERSAGPLALLVIPGHHQIRVDLNANDHSPWLVDGEPLDAVEFVEVPKD